MKNSNDFINPTNTVRFQATINKQPKPQAPSIKHQAKKASSRKLQATSNKRPDF